MIDNLIEKNKKHLMLILIILVLVPIFANLLFSDWSLSQQIENLYLSILGMILGAIGAFIVVGFQVINPLCSRRFLKLGCDFFLITCSLYILLASLYLLWECIISHQGINTFYFSLLGLLIVTYWIREKYALQSSRFKV